MSRADDLGDRMKGYESSTPAVLSPDRPIVVRLDGRAFHHYTRGLERPFDRQLSSDLDEAAAKLCADVDGARLAYLQSDECSVVVPPRSNHAGEHWFGGKVQKIASVAASLFTAHVVRQRGDLAQFDARVMQLPDLEQVRAYLCWRQADARRNAVSMVASAHFSHRQLLGVPVPKRREMLLASGIDVDGDVDARDLLGRVVRRETFRTDAGDGVERTGEARTAVATRSRWVATPAPVFREHDDVPHLHAKAA